jgi:hypothetical protein
MITKAIYGKDPITGIAICVSATIDGVEKSVPLDPNNRDYQAIQEWVAEGNTIEEAA